VTHERPSGLAKAAGKGIVAGLAGVAAMTLAEKAEQAVTGRPDSYVPGRTLLTMMGRRAPDSARPVVWNHAMHWGTGALLGALRGSWASVGIRGTRANTVHTVVRLAFDQSVENLTGAGAPPSTWPVQEQVVDAGHKAVYSFVAGWLADRLVAADQQSARGVVSH
jgi:hypothetical protein